MADDVEYYIKFPPPSTQCSSLTNSIVDDFVLVHNEAAPPVVVLLGWAGCQDKYLSKYSAIYEEKGCITLRCTAPLTSLFLRRSRLGDLGQRLVDLLLDLNLHQHPIFFHVFSNGGAYLYKHMSQAMREREEPIKIQGVVWDSAPGERRFLSSFLALKAILATPGSGPCARWSLLACPIALSLALLLTALYAAEVLVRGALSLRPLPFDPLAGLAQLPAACPQLFIYSPADKLIPYQHIERFAEKRRIVGEQVTALRLEESPHVQHFITHRDAYISAVLTFVRDVQTGAKRSPRPTSQGV